MENKLTSFYFYNLSRQVLLLVIINVGDFYIPAPTEAFSCQLKGFILREWLVYRLVFVVFVVVVFVSIKHSLCFIKHCFYLYVGSGTTLRTKQNYFLVVTVLSLSLCSHTENRCMQPNLKSIFKYCKNGMFFFYFECTEQITKSVVILQVTDDLMHFFF